MKRILLKWKEFLAIIEHFGCSVCSWLVSWLPILDGRERKKIVIWGDGSCSVYSKYFSIVFRSSTEVDVEANPDVPEMWMTIISYEDTEGYSPVDSCTKLDQLIGVMNRAYCSKKPFGIFHHVKSIDHITNLENKFILLNSQNYEVRRMDNLVILLPKKSKTNNFHIIGNIHEFDDYFKEDKWKVIVENFCEGLECTKQVIKIPTNTKELLSHLSLDDLQKKDVL